MVNVAIVFLFALAGAIVAACGIGFGYGFGAQFTATRAVVLLCSGAGIGGLLVTLRVLFSPSFDHRETVRTLWGFGLLVVVLAAIIGGVML